MDRFHIEILAAPDAAHHVATLHALIRADAELSVAADLWTRSSLPRQADLYAALVVVSPGLASATDIARKVRQVSRNGFPVIAVVEDVEKFKFDEAPLEEIRPHNAEGLSNQERLIRSLLHHGGLRLFESGGKVFISHARADGADVAHTIRDAFLQAGIGQTVDVYAFPGGDLIQRDIEERVRNADLLVLVDSKGAARSEWVARELDMAFSYHVPVVAVTPVAGAFHHMVEVPHIPWGPGDEVAPAVLAAVRRLLGRQLAFRSRVARVIERLASLRRWHVVPAGARWVLRPDPTVALHVDAVESHPLVEHVMMLRELCLPNRGLLVAGVRPLASLTLDGLHRAGGHEIRVSPLPTLAAKIPAHLSGRPLTGKRIFLSASRPSTAEDIALARHTFGPFIASMTQAIAELGATLVFGGHPTVSPLVHECIRSLVTSDSGSIELHQAEMWRRDKATVPLDVQEGPIFQNVHWHGAGIDPGDDVAALRDAMISDSLDAAVFVGGKTEGYVGEASGKPPGILDEHQRFIRACPGRPAFVVGLAGGAARQIPVEGPQIFETIFSTADPDLAVALIVAELLGL